VVGGNDLDGLRLEADGTQVLGNYIGLGTGGTTDLGNGRNGVTIADAAGNTLGGSSPGARNVISGNAANGVDMAGADATTIAGNFIGTDAAGSTPVGNGRLGVRIASLSSANTIGGDVSEAENLFVGNADDAIGVVDGAGNGNVIARNVGSAATAPFIDLDPADGPGNDPATGPQGGAQPPVVVHANAAGADGTAPPGATVRVFRSASAPGSAPADIQAFLGSAIADATGAWQASYSAAVPDGTGVTATQTTAAGTSELSAVRATGDNPPDTPIVSAPGGGPAPTTVPIADTSKPVVERFTVTNKVFRRSSSPTPLGTRRKRPRGTTFRFQSSEAGVVKLVIERVVAGRRVGRRCLADSRARRKRRRCTRFVRAATLTRTGAVGQNRIAFSGRAGRKALPIGRYRGSLQVTDAAGNASNVKRVSFRIVR
jgi:hypothetical protein